MIKRKGEVLIPKGATVIEEGDILVLSGENIEELIDKELQKSPKEKTS